MMQGKYLNTKASIDMPPAMCMWQTCTAYHVAPCHTHGVFGRFTSSANSSWSSGLWAFALIVSSSSLISAGTARLCARCACTAIHGLCNPRPYDLKCALRMLSCSSLRVTSVGCTIGHAGAI